MSGDEYIPLLCPNFPLNKMIKKTDCNTPITLVILSYVDEEGYKIYQLLPLKDMNSYSIKDEILLNLSRRIAMATNTNVLSRFGSSSYQVLVLFMWVSH